MGLKWKVWEFSLWQLFWHFCWIHFLQIFISLHRPLWTSHRPISTCFPGPTICLLVNTDFWEHLTLELQIILGNIWSIYPNPLRPRSQPVSVSNTPIFFKQLLSINFFVGHYIPQAPPGRERTFPSSMPKGCLSCHRPLHLKNKLFLYKWVTDTFPFCTKNLFSSSPVYIKILYGFFAFRFWTAIPSLHVLSGIPLRVLLHE